MSRSLDDVRAEFDAVDAALVALVAQRMRLASEAGQLKKAAGRPAVDAAREAQTKRARAKLCQVHGVSPDVVEAVFAALISASRDTQR